MSKILRLVSMSALFVMALSAAHAQMRTTEFMYDGHDKEFVEFTNIGAIPVDMTGYSYDDDSRIAGAFSLGGFGIVKPGESVILAEKSAADFRTAWGLCSNVKIIGGLSVNLGRADEINLFDASGTLADRLSFGDEAIAGSIRTQNKSGWVTVSGLGANNILEWTFSSVSPADGEGSHTSAGGDIGSPGKSSRATVVYEACPAGIMRITEFMYDGHDKEFVEFTNTGTTAVDMTGYSYDDDSRVAGAFSLSAFGIVQPGESVILSEKPATDFRAAWALCNGTKIIGGLSVNLGRADEVNLFDASNTLADRLSFGDEVIAGSIRTQNKSAWVTDAGVGANNILAWAFSSIGDPEGSFTSAGGDIGSPGKSTRVIVSYDPCISIVTGAPVIAMDIAATDNSIDGGAALSPTSPYATSGVINGPADPVGTQGINFTISDDLTPAGDLNVTVSSSNLSVVPAANLLLTGSGVTRNLKISPVAAGYTTIKVKVSDGTYSSEYVLSYAASQAISSASQWPTGIADASAALALDDNYMVIANDETNLFYIYDRNRSGLPLKTYDFNAGNILALTDGSTGSWKEADVEAVVRSIAHSGRTYWLGSMSNSSSFNDKPNRDRIISVDISGTGMSTSFVNTGYSTGLRSRLISWGDTHGYDFSASAAEGKDPKLVDGFNAEGLVFAPDNTTLYIGFRAPLVPMGSRTRAVIAPVQNFETWFNNGAPAGNPTIGNPIELDLGGRGIRDMIRLANGNYVIVAGSYDETSIPSIFLWSGNAGSNPQLLSSFDLAGLNAEAVLPVYEDGQLRDKLQIICDNGDNIFYTDGVAAKDLAQDNFKKFNSVVVVSSVGNALPVHFEYFTAEGHGADVQLSWKNNDMDNASAFEVMRSEDGRSFVSIGTVGTVQNQVTYTFKDVNPGTGRHYYRIDARDGYGQSYLSTIRSVNMNGVDRWLVKIYPNPVTNGVVSIQVNRIGTKRIAVYNNAGILYKQMAFAGSVRDISTGSWPKGYYLLQLTTDDGTVMTEKVIIQ